MYHLADHCQSVDPRIFLFSALGVALTSSPYRLFSEWLRIGGGGWVLWRSVGYQRTETEVMFTTVVLLNAVVQGSAFGDKLAHNLSKRLFLSFYLIGPIKVCKDLNGSRMTGLHDNGCNPLSGRVD